MYEHIFVYFIHLIHYFNLFVMIHKMKLILKVSICRFWPNFVFHYDIVYVIPEGKTIKDLASVLINH